MAFVVVGVFILGVVALVALNSGGDSSSKPDPPKSAWEQCNETVRDSLKHISEKTGIPVGDEPSVYRAVVADCGPPPP
jgi:hypothetical protein